MSYKTLLELILHPLIQWCTITDQYSQVLQNISDSNKNPTGKTSRSAVKSVPSTVHKRKINSRPDLYNERNIDDLLRVQHPGSCTVCGQKAYDSVKRDKLKIALGEFQILAKLQRLVSMTLRNTTSNVKVRGRTSEDFEIRTKTLFQHSYSI